MADRELGHVTKMADTPLNVLLTRDMVDISVGPSATHWILHEELLCARSSFFRRAFSTSPSPESPTRPPSQHDDVQNPSGGPPTPAGKGAPHESPAAKAIRLPGDDDDTFAAFVAWLYSGTTPPASTEASLTPLIDLHLLAERYGVPALHASTFVSIRSYYAASKTYPGLRRVQYVYANTAPGSALREMMIGSVARMLVLGENTNGEAVGKDGRRMPQHWEKALRKNGMLGADVLAKVMSWGLGKENVPDARFDEGEKGRGDVEKEQKPTTKRKDSGAGEVGVKQEEPDDGEKFNLKTLDRELPDGLVDGAH